MLSSEVLNDSQLNSLEEKTILNLKNLDWKVNPPDNDPTAFTTKVWENFDNAEKQRIVTKANEILTHINESGFQMIISWLATPERIWLTENIAGDINQYKILYENIYTNYLSTALLTWLWFSKPDDLLINFNSTTDEQVKKGIWNENLANWRALSILNVLLEAWVVDINNIDKVTIIINSKSDRTWWYVDYNFDRVPKNPPYEVVLMAEKQNYIKSSFETSVTALNSSILNGIVNNSIKEDLLGKKNNDWELISSKKNEEKGYLYDQQTLFKYILNYPIGYINESFFNSDDFTSTDEFNKYSSFFDSNKKITISDLLQYSYGTNTGSYWEKLETEITTKKIYKDEDNKTSPEQIIKEKKQNNNVFDGKDINRSKEWETPIALEAIVPRLYHWNSLFLDKELTPETLKIKTTEWKFEDVIEKPVIKEIKDWWEVYPFKTTIVTIQKNEYEEISNVNWKKTYKEPWNVKTYDIILFWSWEDFISREQIENWKPKSKPYEKYKENITN